MELLFIDSPIDNRPPAPNLTYPRLCCAASGCKRITCSRSSAGASDRPDLNKGSKQSIPSHQTRSHHISNCIGLDARAQWLTKWRRLPPACPPSILFCTRTGGLLAQNPRSRSHGRIRDLLQLRYTRNNKRTIEVLNPC